MAVNIVVGLGRSGLAAAQLLNWQGENVLVIEKSKGDSFKELSEELNKLGIPVELGFDLDLANFEKLIPQIKSIIISPAKSLTLICLAISSAASKFVAKAVLSSK